MEGDGPVLFGELPEFPANCFSTLFWPNKNIRSRALRRANREESFLFRKAQLSVHKPRHLCMWINRRLVLFRASFDDPLRTKLSPIMSEDAQTFRYTGAGGFKFLFDNARSLPAPVRRAEAPVF